MTNELIWPLSGRDSDVGYPTKMDDGRASLEVEVPGQSDQASKNSDSATQVNHPDGGLSFLAIANSIDQMIWSTQPDGFHDYYNERWYEYTGVPLGSTDGEAWNGMFHPDDQDRAWKV